MHNREEVRAGGSGRTSRQRNEHEQADSGEAGSRTQSSEKIKKQLSEWLRRPENADRGDFDTAVGYLAWRIKHPIHLQDASGAIRAFPGLPGQSRGWGKAISIPAPAPGRGDHAERSPWSSLEPIVHAVPEGQGLSPHEVSAYAQYFWKRGEAVRALTALMNSSGSRQAHHRSDWSAFVTGPSGERRPEEALLRRVNTVADYIGKIRQEEQSAARAPSSIAPMSESPTTSPMMPDTQPRAVDMVDTGADDQAQIMPSPDSAYPSVALADTGIRADEPGQSADILAQAMAVLNEDAAAEDVMDEVPYEESAALAAQRELEDRYLERFVEWLATQQLEIQETSGRGNNCSLYALNMGARATQRRPIEETTLDEAVQEQRQTFVNEAGHGGMSRAMLALDADRGGHGRSLIRNLNQAYGIEEGDEGFVVAMYRPITAISMDDANGAFVPSYMDEHGVVDESPADPTRLIRVMQTDHHYAVILPREAAHAAPPVSKKRPGRPRKQKKEQASANADWPAPCDLCGRQLKTLDGWKNHIFDVHKKKPELAKPKSAKICEVCGKGYKASSALKRHQLQSHAGENSGQREVRENEISDSSAVEGHSSQHTLDMPRKNRDKAKNFPCAVCGEEFSSSTSLRKHAKSHTEKNEKKSFVCKFCGSKYRGMRDLERHKRTHTGEKPFVCDICNKGFAQEINLIEHKVVHTRARPYVCDVCGKDYPFRSSLSKHSRKHTGDRPYKCSTCGEAFFYGYALRKHMRTCFVLPATGVQADEPGQSAAILETAMAVLNDPEPQSDEPGQVGDVLAQEMAELNEDAATDDVMDEMWPEELVAPAVQHELEDRHYAVILPREAAHAAPPVSKRRPGRPRKQKKGQASANAVGVPPGGACEELFENWDTWHTRENEIADSSAVDDHSSQRTLDMPWKNPDKAKNFPCTVCGEEFSSSASLGKHAKSHTEKTVMVELNDPEPRADESEQFGPILTQAMAVLNEDAATDDVMDDTSYEAALAAQRELEDRYLERFVEWLATQQLEIQETSGRGNNCSLYALNMGARATQRRPIEEKTLDEAVQEQRQTFVAEAGHRGMSTAMLALDADRGGHGRSLIRNLNQAYGIAGGDEGFVVAMYRPITAISMDDGNGAFVPSYMDEHGVVNESPADPTRLIRVMQTDHHYAVILPREAAHAAPPVSKRGRGRPRKQTKGQAGVNAAGPLSCEACEELFENWNTWHTHMQEMHGKPKPANICEFCGKGYAKSDTLRIHQRRSHAGENSGQRVVRETEISDSSAVEGYSRQRTLGMPRKNPGKAKNFPCTVCGEEFSSSRSLRKHAKSHAKKKSFVCDICEKGFKDSTQLKIHERSHTGEKPYVCGTCGKGFAAPAGLYRHRLTHTGEKPHRCETCDASFATSTNLKEHQRRHTGDRPYVCEVCGKAIKHYATFSRHRKMHGRPNVEKKSFVCKFCSQRFKRTRDLENHERTHTGEKPFVCNVCNKGFAQKINLTMHMKHGWHRKPV
ncbi:C2H2-type zinc finger protein (plasmid) [Burkholderia sp. MS455]|uniref:C2H2-type zinc finger protein n=1 Tax=Burkholderia sp. MS455 TaxID=2811788 RepID=UPI00195D79E8|nr:C2H2-type zinc finger protein [Burkholderia sp. MS455]QRR11750.1 C2H2-type zinc finger protein [Burkholderia sp. MS455]